MLIVIAWENNGKIIRIEAFTRIIYGGINMEFISITILVTYPETGSMGGMWWSS